MPKKKSLPSWRAKDLRILLSPQRMLAHFLKESLKTTGADRGSIRLMNPNTRMLDVEAAIGLTQKAQKTSLQMGEGITGYVAGTGKLLRIDDVRSERRYVDLNSRTRSELALPIEIDSQVVGVLNLESNREHCFGVEDEVYLSLMVVEMGEYLRQGWEIDRLRSAEQQLTSLVDISQAIFSEIVLDQALQQTTRLVCQLMNSRLCSLMLVSENGKELVLRACHGAGADYQNKPNVPLEESLLGVVLKRRKPITVWNVQEHDGYLHPEIARKEGLVSLLAVPLQTGERLLGVLSVYMPQLHRFSVAEIQILSTLASLAALAIEKGDLMERVIAMEENLRQGERLSAIGMLAAEIAHEIRNPLTVVQMLFHGISSTVPRDEGTLKDVEIITDKMKLMNRIVDQVLTFARSAEPAMKPVAALNLFQDVALLTRHKLSAQEVKTKISIPLALPEWKADRAQVEQALLNLVLNAADAMLEGGTLTLGAISEEMEGIRYVTLSIRDTGHGMPADQVEKLFTSFLSSKQGGTGIGLAIVRKIMESHRGKIQVTSKVGKGTEFRLLFPVA